MTTEVLYSTQARATGGRDGVAETQDGSFKIALSTPKELGGDGREGNNPEQLFAAGYAACFLGAIKHVAAHDDNVKTKLPEDLTVTTTVGIGPRSEGGFGLDVQISVAIPGLDRDHAEKLIGIAHEVCPYSNATRNGLNITPTLA
ncbi:organic hydroperoxide resistance protein [Aestuariibius sp. HNIBRBA575]|uniref:organic hydroperoxide resistance protein n=1 Tax=Aestuariibius sp. HNIBRBA575 TaxID=3233343 RepID=UPI0034A16F4B